MRWQGVVAVLVLGLFAGIASAEEAPAADEAPAAPEWDQNRVTVLAAELDRLLVEVRKALTIAREGQTEIQRREQAAAMATLADMENTSKRLFTVLQTGADREGTERLVREIESQRGFLRQRAEEAGFGAEALETIASARKILEELLRYYP